MNPVLKNRIVLAAVALMAVFLGFQIADGQFVLATLVIGVALVWISSVFVTTELDACVAGVVIFGYLVGNRGFAQLLFPGIPLLPGEFALGVGCLYAMLRSARTKDLPWKTDLLNVALLLWILFAAVRFSFDIRRYGFVALRDFALAYYGLFFYLAQHWAGNDRSRGWLERCFSAGFVLTTPVFILFTLETDWFVNTIQVFGTPLIYVKSDVAGSLIVAALVVALWRLRDSNKFLWVMTALVALVGIYFSNSRAAIVGFATVIAWFAVLRQTRVLKWLGVLMAAALFAMLGHAVVSHEPFVRTPFYRLLESTASIVDFDSSRKYASTELADKPDNNQFRLTWWRSVAGETIEKSPWVGLGFGYDLSDQFQREYYPAGVDDFTARSPHNFLFTIFGRMGLLGLVLILAIIAAMARKTWQAGRLALADASASSPIVGWLCAWAIFACGCFGVVLESPVGAIPFWVMLGLANGMPAPETKEDAKALD